MEDPDPRNNNTKPSSATTNPPPPSSLVVVVNNDQAGYGAAFVDVNGVAADDYGHNMAMQLRNQGRMLNMGGSRELWIPPGFKFMPTDEELIMDYLVPKLWNRSLPCAIIESVNIYDYDPPQLTERYKRHSTCSDWFFFTPREKKYPNGKRPNRAAGDGFWKATGADKPITVGGRNVGCRKALVYYSGKPPNGTKTNWIMHEYRADNAPLLTKNSASTSSSMDMRLDQWVLCRMYQKLGRGSQEPTNDPEMNGQDQQGHDDGSGGNQDQEDPRAEDHASSMDATRGRDVNQAAGSSFHGDANHHQMVAYDLHMMNNSNNHGLVQQRYSTYQQDTMRSGSYDHVGVNGNDNHNHNHNSNYSLGGVVRREESVEYKRVGPVIPRPRIEHAVDHRQRTGNNFPADHQTSGMCFDDGDNNGGGGDYMYLDNDDPLIFLGQELLVPGYDVGLQGFGECGFNEQHNVSMQPNEMMSNGNDNNAPPSGDEDDKKKKSVVLDHRQL